MANSRLEKVGNIFIRTTGLLRSGALKPEDRPIWYDIYAAYPPINEPRFDRKAPNIEIKNLFYPEDKIRAKFHKLNANTGFVNLSDRQNKTNCQQLIGIYKKLEAQGALSEDAIFETALDMLKTQLEANRAKAAAAAAENSENINLLADFKEASATEGNKGPSVNLSDIFKS